MADSHTPICAICNQVIGTEHQTRTNNYACCIKLKTVHIKCAQTYFVFTNPGETFKIEEWTTKTAIKVYYYECERSCFWSGNKSLLTE